MANELEIAKPVSIGVVDCARWFAQADSEQQALFFAHVCDIAYQTYKGPPTYQWSYVRTELGKDDYVGAVSMLREMLPE